jgi:hypothetical protein
VTRGTRMIKDKRCSHSPLARGIVSERSKFDTLLIAVETH